MLSLITTQRRNRASKIIRKLAIAIILSLITIQLRDRASSQTRSRTAIILSLITIQLRDRASRQVRRQMALILNPTTTQPRNRTTTLLSRASRQIRNLAISNRTSQIITQPHSRATSINHLHLAITQRRNRASRPVLNLTILLLGRHSKPLLHLPISLTDLTIPI